MSRTLSDTLARGNNVGGGVRDLLPRRKGPRANANEDLRWAGFHNIEPTRKTLPVRHLGKRSGAVVTQGDATFRSRRSHHVPRCRRLGCGADKAMATAR